MADKPTTPKSALDLAGVMGTLAAESVRNPALIDVFDEIADHITAAIELIVGASK